VLYSVFVAVEEITKDVYAEVSAATPEKAAAFLVNLVAQSPEKIIAVSTEMHSAFTDWSAGFNEDMASVGPHPFAVACRAHGIVHTRSTPPHTKPPKIRSPGVEIRQSGGPSNRSVGLRQSGAGIAAVVKTPWDNRFVARGHSNGKIGVQICPSRKARCEKKALRTASKNRSGPLRGPNSML
jgi:hypothetical protein